MPVKKSDSAVKRQVVVKKATPTKVAASKKVGFGVDVVDLSGKVVGRQEVSKEVFGVSVNEALMKQALRVYLTNESVMPGNTKTRGEVRGSTKKIYKQKGTGRARHGAVRAPIFVGGGVAMGPRTREVKLDLPKKMKKAALGNMFALRFSEGEILGVVGLEKATGKTKEMAAWMKALAKDRVLLLVDKDEELEMGRRGVANLANITWQGVDMASILDILRHKSLVMTKKAIENVEAKFKEGANA